MKSLKKIIVGAIAALSVVACVNENPTEVGSSLIEGSEVTTFEVLLAPADYLVFDTAFSGYSKPSEVAFALVANKFENTVDAHTLLRFSIPPTAMNVRSTTTNTIVADTLLTWFSGRMVVKFDTFPTPRATPASVSLYRTGEPWDISATWINRVDTVGVKLPWATPGGTLGARIDTTTWSAGDSIVFNVDSQTVAIWRDTTQAARGALILTDTKGARMHILSAKTTLSAHSSLRPDTVLTADVVSTVRTFVFTPTLPSPFSAPRVGGVPAWRTIIKLRSDLAMLKFACPTGTTCNVPLDSAHISRAELLLKPVKSPPGFAPEDSMFLDVRSLAVSPQVPLERTPLGNRVALSKVIEPVQFQNPGPNDVLKLDVTSFLSHMTNPDVAVADQLAPYLALLQVPEGTTFGVAQFQALPTLRIVLTTAVERKP